MVNHPKSTQKTVAIDQQLWHDLDEWLQTEEAKKLGYHSKARFANEAISNLLLERRKIQFTNITFLEEEGKIMLVDNGIDIKSDPRVEIWMKKDEEFICQTCDDDDCIHIKAVKESTAYKEFIEKKEIAFQNFLEAEYEAQQQEAMFEAGIDSSITED